MPQLRAKAGRVVGRLLATLDHWGINLRKTSGTFMALGWYYNDLRVFKQQARMRSSPFPLSVNLPYVLDKKANAGSSKHQYFVQDLFVAQRVFANNPERHVDVGSRVDGFVAHVASFRVIEVLDIRPIDIGVPGIRFKQCDIMAELDENLIHYCDSLSSLHVIEHFGLGRYGDPIDYDGHMKGFNNLYRILKPGGKLYLSVPIGPQRIEFNAHRVFSLAYLLEMIGDKYQIDLFTYVDDHSQLHTNVELTPERIATNCGCRFGCAIFEMTKLPHDSSASHSRDISPVSTL
jgi:SAM-dependent methyltransferase